MSSPERYQLIAHIALGLTLAACTPGDRGSAGPPPSQRVQIFLIALHDNGRNGRRVGCSDSVVPVTAMIDPGQPPVEGALRALLGLDREALGGPELTNPLFRSRLRLEGVEIWNGRAEVHLGGTLRVSGICDPPRIRAQLTETALQFDEVGEVVLYLNGRPLDEALERWRGDS